MKSKTPHNDEQNFLNEVYGPLNDPGNNPYKEEYSKLKSDANYQAEILIGMFKSGCGIYGNQLPTDLHIKKFIFLMEFSKCKNFEVKKLFYKKIIENKLVEHAKECSFYDELESFCQALELKDELSKTLESKSNITKKPKI